jgi:hypothetical protein
MKNYYQRLVLWMVVLFSSQVWATTCPNAIPITTFPVVNQALVCGTTNDLSSTTVTAPWCGTVGSTSYYV